MKLSKEAFVARVLEDQRKRFHEAQEERKRNKEKRETVLGYYTDRKRRIEHMNTIRSKGGRRH